MEIRVGVDLVSIGSLEAMVGGRLGDRFLRRLFTDREVADCSVDGRPRADRLASSFAVKEAAVKVLPGASVLAGRGIAVHAQPGGRTLVVLSGRAEELAARAGVRSLRASTACRDGYAIAVVLAEAEGRAGQGP